jgi:polyhydroxyalkanoate synthesis repressor PhaR
VSSDGKAHDERTNTDRRIKLRKYRNRRYYDITRSQHVTLDAIHSLVRDGYDIEVTDAETDEDITAKVLAQIILDHDPPKLNLFPVELLHQIIRANEPLVRDFIEKYFSQAFLAFCESQKQFNQYLRQAMGLDSSYAPAAAWPRFMLGPLAQGFFTNGGQMPAEPQSSDGDEAPEDLRALVEQLCQQVNDLQGQLRAQQSDKEGAVEADQG